MKGARPRQQAQATASAEDLIQRYIDHLNRLLNQTITTSRLTHLRGPASGEWFISRVVGENRLAPLELRPNGRWLHFRQAVTVRRKDSKVIVREASYHFSYSDNPDDEEAKVFMYHYHRMGRPGQPQSHYHVFGDRGGASVRALHFPAGRVSIEQIVAHLLTDQKVACRRRLEDAIVLLRASHKKFMTLRTDDPLFP